MPYVPGPSNDMIWIPGPNNELIHPTSSNPPQYPIMADSASWAATASYFVGYIESSSYSKYAETASYLTGLIESASYAKNADTSSWSISASFARWAATASYILGTVQNAVSCSWAALAGHALTAETASYALQSGTSSFGLVAVSSSQSAKAVSASYADTASYVATSSWSNKSTTSSFSLVSSYSDYATSSSQSVTASYLNGTASYAVNAQTASYVRLDSVELNTPLATKAYMVAGEVHDVDDPTIIDIFPTNEGLSAKWLLSIWDGTNFKTSEILAIWNPGNNSTNFAEVTTNSLGTIPLAMSVTLSAGQVRLMANPVSGIWNIKYIRFLL